MRKLAEKLDVKILNYLRAMDALPTPPGLLPVTRVSQDSDWSIVVQGRVSTIYTQPTSTE
jgi:hypothetical protein